MPTQTDLKRRDQIKDLLPRLTGRALELLHAVALESYKLQKEDEANARRKN